MNLLNLLIAASQHSLLQTGLQIGASNIICCFTRRHDGHYAAHVDQRVLQYLHSLCVVSHERMNVWKGSNISLLVLQHWHLLLFKVCIAIHLSPKNHLNNQIFYRFYRTFSASGHPQY